MCNVYGTRPSLKPAQKVLNLRKKNAKTKLQGLGIQRIHTLKNFEKNWSVKTKTGGFL
jgi:hypothetical protein